MAWFSEVNWAEIFTPDTPFLEIIARGSVMYLSLFVLLRVILKRQSGAVGVSDLLVIVLIADAAQNGMAGQYNSVPDGILLVATLIFWNYTLEWLGFHFPAFDRLISPAPLPLIKHGKLLRQNMKKELITEEDLLSQMRQQGIDDMKQIKQACIEGDGKISIVTYQKQQRHKPHETSV